MTSYLGREVFPMVALTRQSSNPIHHALLAWYGHRNQQRGGGLKIGVRTLLSSPDSIRGAPLEP